MERIKYVVGILGSQYAGECGDTRRSCSPLEWAFMFAEVVKAATEWQVFEREAKRENRGLPPLPPPRPGNVIAYQLSEEDGGIQYTEVELVLNEEPAIRADYWNAEREEWEEKEDRFVYEWGPNNVPLLCTTRYIRLLEED